MGRSPGTRVAALAAGALLAACSGLAPVARYPWVEDRGLALVAEELSLAVGEREVAVEAVFHFAAEDGGRARAATFPIAAPGGPADDFAAVLVGADGRAAPLAVHRGAEGTLPAGDVVEWYSFELPAGLGADGAALRVRYRQPVDGEARYVLKTGAYWRGPIGSLRVWVTDRGGGVLGAQVEGRDGTPAGAGTLAWTFRDVEPRDGVVVTLRDPAAPGDGAVR